MRYLWVFFLLLFTFLNSYAYTPRPGEKVYTIQVASFKSREEAFRVLKEVSDLPAARVALRNGRYKVRVGFFKTYFDARNFIKKTKLDRRVSSFYITRITYTPRNVFFASSLSRIKKLEKSKPKKKSRSVIKKVKLPPPSSLLKEVSFKEKVSVVKLPPPKTLLERPSYQVFVYSDLPKIKEKVDSPPEEEKGSWKGKTVFGLLLAISVAVGGSILFRRRFKKTVQREGENFETYIARLLEKEKYDEIVSLAAPYLAKNPHDTFVKRALAESLERTGHYLEAAEVYRELAEDLSKKGLDVLSQEFEKKAEELYGREFKR